MLSDTGGKGVDGTNFQNVTCKLIRPTHCDSFTNLSRFIILGLRRTEMRRGSVPIGNELHGQISQCYGH